MLSHFNGANEMRDTLRVLCRIVVLLFVVNVLGYFLLQAITLPLPVR